MLNLMNLPIKYPVWILKHCHSSGWHWVLAEMPFTKPVYPFPLPHGPQLPFLCSVVLSWMGALAPGRLPSQRTAGTWLTQWYKSTPLPSRAPLCVAVCALGLLCDQTEASLQPRTHPCSPFLFSALSCCLSFWKRAHPRQITAITRALLLGNPGLGIHQLWKHLYSR